MNQSTIVQNKKQYIALHLSQVITELKFLPTVTEVDVKDDYVLQNDSHVKCRCVLFSYLYFHCH